MKIAVAMSGGVDSSVTGALLKKEGHTVIGITAKILLCSEMDCSKPRFDVCCSPENLYDAQKVAKQLGFSHYTVNVEDDFLQKVIEPFCKDYCKGRTPSPCINCNTYIKFPKLLAIANELGCEALATGHYATLCKNDRYYIKQGKDVDKDQSYFLFNLSQDILAQVLLPLGQYTKQEIRQIAQSFGLHIAHKPESQEICFVQDNDYPRYIEQRLGHTPPQGNIVTSDGKIVGTHRGIHRYTIGQRKGLGIAWGHPLYVIGIDAQNNQIIVGSRNELFAHGLIASQINYMKATYLNNTPVWIKTRSTQVPFKAYASIIHNTLHIEFEKKQASITPGQAVVCYDDEGAILAGAWIDKSL